ncbi:gliding motility lipoprotein GldD [Parapedobacter tibetensis]|uniref:gliding motility lipoprotein GldD n=1 Tax=Parapedobacter tibetensis TaxID=2972951 RepID=UPI00214D34A7|nr:gliding motility lipoprotein GldD [Parapedobacter tibetensis]
MDNRMTYLVFWGLVVFTICSCQYDYSPKPRGYFRIAFPEKAYHTFSSTCPYEFDIPVYAEMGSDRSPDAQPCWMDIKFPQFNAQIHLTYMTIRDLENFNELVEDARTLAFNHTVRATAIDQQRINRSEARVHGLKYEIKGNAASSIQFFVTDSTKHYLRGALYFHEKPRLDSIQPVLDFIKADIDTLIHSLRWK